MRVLKSANAYTHVLFNMNMMTETELLEKLWKHIPLVYSTEEEYP